MMFSLLPVITFMFVFRRIPKLMEYLLTPHSYTYLVQSGIALKGNQKTRDKEGELNFGVAESL